MPLAPRSNTTKASHKIEVINSASSAFRQFVKEKSAIRKMQESLIMQRALKSQAKNMNNM